MKPVDKADAKDKGGASGTAAIDAAKKAQDTKNAAKNQSAEESKTKVTDSKTQDKNKSADPKVPA